MAKKKTKKAILEEIKKDLFASDDVIVQAAIDKALEHGDESLIIPMLTVYRDSESEGIRLNLEKLLSSLKISKAEGELIKALDDENFKNEWGTIVSFIWNSGFQPAEKIQRVCQVALEGSFMDALECLTLLENIDGPFEEEWLMESLIDVRAYLTDKKNQDQEKYSLIVAIKDQLTQMEAYS